MKIHLVVQKYAFNFDIIKSFDRHLSNFIDSHTNPSKKIYLLSQILEVSNDILWSQNTSIILYSNNALFFQPAAVEELRRWTSTEALGDITVTPDCPNRIPPNVSHLGEDTTDGTVISDDEGIDHKLPSPEEQVQVVALK